MKEQDKKVIEEHLARAKANNLSVSTKHSIELCSHLRYKTTNFAKNALEAVISLKKPIPFKRFKTDMGHKPGMAAGRYPQKAAKEVLKLIKAAETNAQFKGLNTANLKIIKILANRASVPLTGGRQRTATKRTNLEIEVMETKEKKKKGEKTVKKETPAEKPKTEEIKEEVKKETPIKEEVKEKKEPEVKEEKKETVEEKPVIAEKKEVEEKPTEQPVEVKEQPKVEAGEQEK